MIKKIILIGILGMVWRTSFWGQPAPVFDYRSALGDKTSLERPVVADDALYSARLRYVSPLQMKGTLAGVFPSMFIGTNGNDGIVVLKGLARDVEKAKKLIRQLDVPKRMIKLDVSILEISYSNYEQYKHLFSDISTSLKVDVVPSEPSLKLPLSYTELLSLLTTEGKAKLLAKPSLSTLENQKATIHIGDKIPYTTTVFVDKATTTQVNYFSTGLDLEITPSVVSDNGVVTDLLARLTTVKNWKSLADQSQLPILSTREAQTMVQVAGGDYVVLAGLFDQAERKSAGGVPFLKDLPGVGFLFQQTVTEIESTDLLFILRPQVVDCVLSSESIKAERTLQDRDSALKTFAPTLTYLR